MPEEIQRNVSKHTSLHELAQLYRASKDDDYLTFYERNFSESRSMFRNVLELGVQGGGSLKMWRDYFPNAQVYGVDIADCSSVARGERISFYQGRQEDQDFLKSITHRIPDGKFDLIIDDASHFGLYSKLTFKHLFDEHLKPGGIYVIEDWGTGYWDEWPDGGRYQYVPHETENPHQKETKFIYQQDEATGLLPKLFHSHQFGMVGFVKQLVDEAHHGAIKNSYPRRVSKFESMAITEGVVLIRKRQ